MASVYEAFAADGAVAGYYYDVNEIDAIDIVSGATVTSGALKEAVKNALAQVK